MKTGMTGFLVGSLFAFLALGCGQRKSVHRSQGMPSSASIDASVSTQSISVAKTVTADTGSLFATAAILPTQSVSDAKTVTAGTGSRVVASATFTGVLYIDMLPGPVSVLLKSLETTNGVYQIITSKDTIYKGFGNTEKSVHWEIGKRYTVTGEFPAKTPPRQTLATAKAGVIDAHVIELLKEQ